MEKGIVCQKPPRLFEDNRTCDSRIEAIRRPGHNETRDVCNSPRRNSHQLGGQGLVAKTSDYGWREEREAGKWCRDEKVYLKKPG